jgi:beta-galactosidase/beta-glucuronidase
LTSRPVFTHSVEALLAKASGSLPATRQNSFAVLRVFGSNGQLQSSDTHVFDSYKNLELAQPKIDVSSRRSDKKDTFVVTIRASAPAAYVWLTSRVAGRFSDNAFTMWEPQFEIEFFARGSDVSLAEFQHDLVVRSLYEAHQTS